MITNLPMLRLTTTFFLLAAVFSSPKTAIGQKNEIRSRESVVAEVLARQKTDRLEIYLGKGRTYVNGKSITLSELTTIIGKSKPKSAAIKSEPKADIPSIIQILHLLKKLKISKVTIAQVADKEKPNAADPKKLKPKAEPSKIDSEKIKEVMARQKSKQLHVYLNNRGTFINGKKVSNVELKDIAAKMKLKKAIITSEPSVAQEKIDAAKKLISDSGIQKIKLDSKRQ